MLEYSKKNLSYAVKGARMRWLQFSLLLHSRLARIMELNFCRGNGKNGASTIPTKTINPLSDSIIADK